MEVLRRTLFAEMPSVKFHRYPDAPYAAVIHKDECDWTVVSRKTTPFYGWWKHFDRLEDARQEAIRHSREHRGRILIQANPLCCRSI